MPSTDYSAYIPLNWEASKLLAGRRIGGCEGKWCIAYQKDKSYWKSYIYSQNLTPIYFIKDKDKYAVMLDGVKVKSVRNKADDEVGLKGIKALGYASKTVFEKELKKNSSQTRKARKILDENVPLNWFEAGIKDGSIKVKDAKYEVWGDLLLWQGGTWIKGTWVDGTWEGGTWLSGTWQDGFWLSGTWQGGTWIKGTWVDGTWEGGTWLSGTWQDGLWIDGIWESGAWKRGIINGKPSKVHP